MDLTLTKRMPIINHFLAQKAAGGQNGLIVKYFLESSINVGELQDYTSDWSSKLEELIKFTVEKLISHSDEAQPSDSQSMLVTMLSLQATATNIIDKLQTKMYKDSQIPKENEVSNDRKDTIEESEDADAKNKNDTEDPSVNMPTYVLEEKKRQDTSIEVSPKINRQDTKRTSIIKRKKLMTDSHKNMYKSSIKRQKTANENDDKQGTKNDIKNPDKNINHVALKKEDPNDANNN